MPRAPRLGPVTTEDKARVLTMRKLNAWHVEYAGYTLDRQHTESRILEMAKRALLDQLNGDRDARLFRFVAPNGARLCAATVVTYLNGASS